MSEERFTQAEVKKELRERGIAVNRNQIYYAIDAGKIPEPEKNGSGQYRYTHEHIRLLAEILG